MSIAQKLLVETSEIGITLVPAGEKLKLRAPSPPPPELVEQLREHKADILRLLRGAEVADGDLAGRARQRILDACKFLGLDPAPILRQFNDWRVTADDMREMLHWTDDTVRRHVELLADEIETGMRP
ncbi:hypothetical protein [Solimonas soli]|uniref:TubC N-terminal docking domain-related protein n=1 Tax=Solimonas soli TaxID=413479 RepID=UPI0004B0F2EE|nr:hypothetical protein [Solimonas soli]